jgi:Transposase DDE domain.
MANEKLVFAQLMEWVPHYHFQRLVKRYSGNYKVSSFTCWDQFLCMSFAQLTYRESLRDIEACLRSRPNLLYHLGIRGKVARSTLADANEERDWHIYADLAQWFIARARKLYAQEDLGLELDDTLYALDSTTIDLCLSLFPWAHFRRHKGAVKMHTLLDLRGSIPTFIRITEGKLHDVNFLDELVLEPGAFYVMDRGYLDFARLYRFALAGAFFVTRAKSNFDFRWRTSREVDRASGVHSDQTVSLAGKQSALDYPEVLRRVSYYDVETKKHFVFLTNNFVLPALTIAKIYHCRWQIELFFKWIKQNLRIKAFYGYSDNAVKTQIWIAVCVYILVGIVKKELKLEPSLSTILQVLSISVFQQEPLPQLFTQDSGVFSENDSSNQLMFNGI